MIVRKLTGKPCGDFLKERICKPLGMTATQVGDSETVVLRRPSTAYNRQSGELRNWANQFGNDGDLAAGLNSTAVDLARFFVALDKGEVLKKESLQALWSPVNGSFFFFGDCP